MGIMDNIKLFFEGALDFKGHSTTAIQNAYEDNLEEFFILAFSDMLGVDLPTSYYSLELYPYLVEDISRWQQNSVNRKSVWEDKGAKMDFDP